MSLAGLVLTSAVKEQARGLGFDAVAIGPAEAPPHADAFERWLQAGYGDGMEYLSRTRADRLMPERLLPGVRSVVAVALSYNPPADADRGDWAGVARYARGHDYHEVMRPRLETLARFIDTTAGVATRSRAAVDTSAVLERDLAARAGLGWIGKNTNLLSPTLGSYFFIGIVLTTAALATDAAQPDHCGTCTACLDACPTRAFVSPWVLDARRCISYLTIEHRGPVAVGLREAIGDWLFGCDVCQEVCPWNRKAQPAGDPAFTSTESLGPLEDILTLDESAFRARFRHTALWRAKRAGLARNAALVLGNRRDPTALEALRRAGEDKDASVREAAGWALNRCSNVD
jgi:epoxyqueuosine reductase